MKKPYIILILIIAFIVISVTIYALPKQQRPNSTNEREGETTLEVVRGGEEQDNQRTPQDTDSDDRGGTEDNENESWPEAYGTPNVSGGPDGEVTDYIREVFGDSASWGLGVAWCESRFVLGRTSPTGKYVGLYQFSVPTFDGNCDGEITDWRAQTRCAKKLYDKGETGHWPNCP